MHVSIILNWLHMGLCFWQTLHVLTNVHLSNNDSLDFVGRLCLHWAMKWTEKELNQLRNGDAPHSTHHLWHMKYVKHAIISLWMHLCYVTMCSASHRSQADKEQSTTCTHWNVERCHSTRYFGWTKQGPSGTKNKDKIYQKKRMPANKREIKEKDKKNQRTEELEDYTSRLDSSFL